jgi:RNA polymerase subunit RPABC4/transcription elongation factor Spt4
MAKLFASKQTKELLTDAEIRKQNLNKDTFTDSWKGKVVVLRPEESEIAKNLKIQKKGEFAVKA